MPTRNAAGRIDRLRRANERLFGLVAHRPRWSLALCGGLREAVHVRFRPILLTTLTAVLGMLPTALGWGQGAAPEQSLAVVILGGMLWSALLTTNLLPGLYLARRRRQAGEEAAG